MKGAEMFSVYAGVTEPDGSDQVAEFAVRQLPGYEAYYIGKDTTGLACLLVSTTSESGRKPAPIRLESIDAQFEIACRVLNSSGETDEGCFTVVRCRSLETETVCYFFSICWIIINHLGDSPTRTALSSSVRRIASIFQNIRKPPTRTLNGLFGELFVILQSRSPIRAVGAWRMDQSSRFDFSVGDARLEVKSCAGRVRKHKFSLDQCNPPENAHAAVASVMVERISGGISIQDIIDSVEERISADQELVLKLHETVASTLGADLAQSLSVTFDQELAENSLRLFDLRQIPAIRGQIPPEVSNVHFDVDLSSIVPLSAEELTNRNPYFWDLLPEE